MKRYVPLTVKVNSLILITLVLGIGIITFFLASRLLDTIETTTKNSLQIQARQIYASIESIMLPGQAELAAGLFSRLALIDRNFESHIFRVDGTEAFVDNSTIRHVNTNLAAKNVDLQFPERNNPSDPNQSIIDENFSIAASGHQVFFEVEENGRTYYRIFKPVINSPKCVFCHGPDHTVRGVLEIKSDISESRGLQRSSILISVGFFLVMFIGSAILLSFFLTRSVLSPVQSIGEVCLGVTQGNFDKRVSVGSNDELGKLGNTVNTMIEGLVERFKLSKYVSSSTIQSIQSSEIDTKVVKTLFFSDIRGFTSFSETQSPEQVVKVLNQVLNIQSQILHDHKGDIDKYVGDEIFAIFDGADAVLRACEASLKIQDKLTEANSELAGLSIGIGIHTGEVIQGMIGSERRADFTVIGDNVNLAARLCSSAKGQEIILSDSAFEKLRGIARATERLQRLRLAGPFMLRVKGKLNEQRIYKLTGART